MRKMMTAVALVLVPAAGEACSYLEPFELGSIGGAEIVVVGEVTGYRSLGTPWGAALVTVRVEAALKGEAEGEVVFVWNGGMAQGPHESRASGRVLIGAAKGGRPAGDDMLPDERPDLPAIVQPYCGEVWMVPATETVVGEARKVLR